MPAHFDELDELACAVLDEDKHIGRVVSLRDIVMVQKHDRSPFHSMMIPVLRNSA